MLSKRWWFTSLFVFVGLLVLLRLGAWQLDRLSQRQVFNARLLGQADQDIFLLSKDNMDENLYEMEYRQISVSGTYDFNSQVTLRNQYQDNQIGVHLLTPLIISSTDKVGILVDRGWIPQVDTSQDNWHKYDELGEVTVIGLVRRSQTVPARRPASSNGRSVRPLRRARVSRPC